MMRDNKNPWRGKVGPWGPRERVAWSPLLAAAARSGSRLKGWETFGDRLSRAVVCVGLGVALGAVMVADLGTGVIFSLGLYLFSMGVAVAFVLKVARDVAGGDARSAARPGAWRFWALCVAMLFGLLWLTTRIDPVPSPARAEIAPAHRGLDQ